MADKRIIFVAVDDPFSRMIYNAVNAVHPIAKVVLEEPVSKITLVKNRIKRLGLLKVTGQLLFQVLVQPTLQRSSKKRIKNILHASGLNTTAFPDSATVQVLSVNKEETITLIHKLKPDLIIINGTRILSKKFVEAFDGKIINIHAGITPEYRGVHGAYWALVNNDAAHCGVTIHSVDKGIDTGTILAQKTISPGPEDNFITYPYLQLSEGVYVLVQKLSSILRNELPVYSRNPAFSRLWYHPTIWEYFYFRGIKKVK